MSVTTSDEYNCLLVYGKRDERSHIYKTAREKGINLEQHFKTRAEAEAAAARASKALNGRIVATTGCHVYF